MAISNGKHRVRGELWNALGLEDWDWGKRKVNHNGGFRHSRRRDDRLWVCRWHRESSTSEGVCPAIDGLDGASFPVTDANSKCDSSVEEMVPGTLLSKECVGNRCFSPVE